MFSMHILYRNIIKNRKHKVFNMLPFVMLLSFDVRTPSLTSNAALLLMMK